MARTPDQPLAVIDIGSNSGRIVVVRLDGGHLDVIAESRVPLRLAGELERGRLPARAVARTIEALNDFKAIADVTGAKQIVAVATSAVREASNSNTVLEQIREESGLDVEVIDGEREAFYAFRGAVGTLSVDDGILFDLGGGSIELTSFRHREVKESWTLPLGSLRMSREFLPSDPPSADEMRSLRDAVRTQLEEAGVPSLHGGTLIGTGGTLRNLARIDRHERSYPIPRLHGYVLSHRRMLSALETLRTRTVAERSALRGLKEDRADSILGGAIVADVVLERCGAEHITISGQGLREGIAYDMLDGPVSAPVDTRRAAVRALSTRFRSWDAARAQRRVEIARAITAVVLPDLDGEGIEMLEHAAALLDIGTSLDFYNRSQHAATIVLTADLTGFTHAQLALVAVLIRRAEDPRCGLKDLRKLIPKSETKMIAPGSVILAVADALEMRLRADDAVRCSARGHDVVVRADVTGGYWFDELAHRMQHATARALRIERGR